MTLRWWDRWGPLAGALSVAGFVIAFAIAGNSPNTDSSDAKIVSYYAKHSHQVSNIVGYFIFLAAIVFLVLFFSVLRSKLVAAEGGAGWLGSLAFGSGVASAALWIAAIICFTGPAFATNDTAKFHLDANTFRLVGDMGYTFWVAAVVVSALVVWSTSAVALRTGLLPRWFGWLGVVIGAINLLAVFFIPAFIYWGWLLVASVFLAWRPAARTSAAPAV
ncbi:MAG: hypothetical protein WBB74_12880 [Gaiellaceae bacterium]